MICGHNNQRYLKKYTFLFKKSCKRIHTFATLNHSMRLLCMLHMAYTHKSF